jgi:hypothetical protein
MVDAPATPQVAAQLNTAWNELCDQLKAAGAVIAREGQGLSEGELAEGYGHLAHLALDALTWATVPDPAFPRFVHMNDTPEIADNRFAAIRSDMSYRLTGDIGSLLDVNISLHEGWPFAGGRRVWGDLGRKDLQVDADGRFELIISREPRPGNWLEAPADARILQIREYYADWDTHRPGRFEIVRLGSEGEAPSMPTAADTAAGFGKIGPWLQGYLATHSHMVRERIATINGVAQPAQAPAGNRNIWYGPGRFRLEPDEALVLSFVPPTAKAWTIQWLTWPWYEPPDLANRGTSLMGRDAYVASDGRVHVVLTATDPGTPNWLDVAGHREGIIMLRWLWCQSAHEVTSAVLRRDQLGDVLPSDTPRIGAAERSAQQARRRAHWASRAR